MSTPPFTFRNDLFVAENGAKMCFDIKECDNKEELSEYIKFGGGAVVKGFGPYTITLQEAAASCSPPAERETYLPDFIMKCCTRNKIVLLKSFRNNTRSIFSDDFNPNEVLLRKINWTEAKELYSKVTDDRSSNSSDLESVSNSVERNRISNALGPRAATHHRCEFSRAEREQIVQFIVNAKAFNDLKGLLVWRRMERKMPNHTAQSLKEHFFKKIKPFLQNYHLSKAILTKFNEGLVAKGTRRSGTKKSYSSKEDKAIVTYVEKYGARASLAGNAFWMAMETDKRKKGLEGRTWQALRERYLKHLKGKKSSEFDDSSSEEVRPKNGKHIESSNSESEDTDSGELNRNSKQSPQRTKVSRQVTESDSDEEESNRNSKQSPQKTKVSRQVVESDSEEEESNRNSKVPNIIKRRKLFTASSMFETPSRYAPCTPVSLSKAGPSMLECMIRQEDQRAKARKRKELSGAKRRQDCSTSNRALVGSNEIKSTPMPCQSSSVKLSEQCEDSLKEVTSIHQHSSLDVPELQSNFSENINSSESNKNAPEGQPLNGEFHIDKNTLNESHGILEDLQSKPNTLESSQDLFASLDPLPERSTVGEANDLAKAYNADSDNSIQANLNLNMSVVLEAENFSPVMLEYLDVSEPEDEPGSDSSATSFEPQLPPSQSHASSNDDQDNECLSSWSEDGMFWAGAIEKTSIVESGNHQRESLRPMQAQCSSRKPIPTTLVVKEPSALQDGLCPNQKRSLNGIESFDFLNDCTKPLQSIEFSMQRSNSPPVVNTSDHNSEADSESIMNTESHHVPWSPKGVDVGVQKCIIKVDACVQTDPVIIIYREENVSVQTDPALISDSQVNHQTPSGSSILQISEKRPETRASLGCHSSKRVTYPSSISPIPATLLPPKRQTSRDGGSDLKPQSVSPSPKYMKVEKL